jgi:hypothetical protein
LTFRKLISLLDEEQIGIFEVLAWLDEHPKRDDVHVMEVVQSEPELYVVECPRCGFKKQLYRAPSGEVEGGHELEPNGSPAWHVWEIGGTLGPATFSIGVERDE